MLAEVMSEARDEHHEHEVEEQLQPRHGAVEVELLVGSEGRRLPDAAGFAHSTPVECEAVMAMPDRTAT